MVYAQVNTTDLYQRKDILEAARRIIYGPVELTHPYLLLLR